MEMRNKNPYLTNPQNINKENLWYIIDKFCSCIWNNTELFIESQNTNFIMMFEKTETKEDICYIAREDWQWIIEIHDLHQRWLFVEEDDLKLVLFDKSTIFYGDILQFEYDLILLKLFGS